MKPVYLIDSARLPIGRYGGQFADVLPETLGAAVVDALLARNQQPAIAGLYCGNVVGGGGNVARRVVLASKLPQVIPALSVDQQCASGLAAIGLAADAIASGNADCLLAGGVESTSRAPWQIARPTRLYGRAPTLLPRAPLSPEAVGDPDMGVACEQLAEAQRLTRGAQDAYAVESQRRYQKAAAAGYFADIVPLAGVTTDESPRPSDLATLARLSPAFTPGGTLTAGNSSPLNDGAAFSLLASAAWCRQNGITPRWRFCGSVSVGVAPQAFCLGPVPAVAELLRRHRLSMAQIDRIELNEAFAAQALACLRVGGWPQARVNPAGGALAFGHPFAATGAILLQHLMLALDACAGRYGIVTMCVGGGMGIAALVERL